MLRRVERVLAKARLANFVWRPTVFPRNDGAAWRRRIDDQHGVAALKGSFRPDVERMAHRMAATGRKDHEGWKRPCPCWLEHLVCFGVAERLWRWRKGQVLSDDRALLGIDVLSSRYGRRLDEQKQQGAGLQHKMHPRLHEIARVDQTRSSTHATL